MGEVRPGLVRKAWSMIIFAGDFHDFGDNDDCNYRNMPLLDFWVNSDEMGETRCLEVSGVSRGDEKAVEHPDTNLRHFL